MVVLVIYVFLIIVVAASLILALALPPEQSNRPALSARRAAFALLWFGFAVTLWGVSGYVDELHVCEEEVTSVDAPPSVTTVTTCKPPRDALALALLAIPGLWLVLPLFSEVGAFGVTAKMRQEARSAAEGKSRVEGRLAAIETQARAAPSGLQSLSELPPPQP